MPTIDKDIPHTPESTTHWACMNIIQSFGAKSLCCGCAKHYCDIAPQLSELEVKTLDKANDMKIYIDTEFNGFNGDLISMALVTESGEEWYEVLYIPSLLIVDPWVAKNVLPKIGDKEPLPIEMFVKSLCAFLSKYDDITVIGDWPADFEHLSNIISLQGKLNNFTIPFECTMMLIKGSPDIKSENPHNALSDAIALKNWHLSIL